MRGRGKVQTDSSLTNGPVTAHCVARCREGRRGLDAAEDASELGCWRGRAT